MKKIIIIAIILIAIVIPVCLYWNLQTSNIRTWLMLFAIEGVLQLLMHFIINYNKYK